MNTFTPIRGMHICIADTGDYVKKSDYDAVAAEASRLAALINSPVLEDFMAGMPIECAHQLQRWGDAHDYDKHPEDWIWLFGVLGGKAIQACRSENYEKAKHHAITGAACMANFHRVIKARADAQEELCPDAREEKV